MQLTRHVDSVREEVARICNKYNETALDLGETSDKGILEQQTRANADDQANHQTAKEDKQEDTDTLKETQDGQMTLGSTLPVLLSSLEENNGNSVIEDRLSEDDGVELWVNFVGVEDGKDCDGIGSGERCADRDGLDKGDVQTLERDAGPDVKDQAQDHGGDESAGESKCENGSNVAEEVPLVEFIAGS